jgi:hypothetical protein
MTGYTAALLDHGSMVLIFGWLAYHYGSSFGKRAARPWVVLLVSLLILYHGVYLVKTLVEGPPPNMDKIVAQTPSRDELIAMVSKAKVVPFDDKVLRLSKGPRITIPAGYKYIEPPEGVVICYSIGPINEVMTVLFLGETSDLVSAEQQIRADALRKKSPWNCGPSRKLTLNGCDAAIMDFTNPVTNQKGYQVLVTNGKFMYSLLIVSPESFARIKEAEFQRVIQSFAVGL